MTERTVFTARDYILPPPLLVFTLIVGVIMAALIAHPGYTDAYYYFNAGQRLIDGYGLTDAGVWTYLGLPDSVRGLPVPSHLYWMPLTSFIAAAGMGAGRSFDAAQIPFVILYVVLVSVGYAVGLKLSGRRFIAWLVAILVMSGGYFAPHFTTTDNFALYGVVGGLCLLYAGFGRERESRGWFAFAGLFAGLAHLTRADGVLLLFVVVAVALLPVRTERGYRLPTNALIHVALPVIAYLFVMSPWMIRTLSVTGSLLPAGGLQTAWMTTYDQIVNYPGRVDLVESLATGSAALLQTRLDAITNNLGTLIAVEGMIVLFPFMLIEAWARRRERFLHAFLLYSILLHVVMTFVFPLPGYRGGLFHSAAALFPFWMALGVLGLERAIVWVAKRRRWQARSAIRFFFQVLVIFALGFSASIFLPRARAWSIDNTNFYNFGIPSSAILLINDPSALYYWRKQSSAVLPNVPVEVLPDVAARFGASYIVVDQGVPSMLINLWTRDLALPNYLRQVYSNENVRVYEFRGILDNAGSTTVN